VKEIHMKTNKASITGQEAVDWSKFMPVDVDMVMQAFPADVIGSLLPPEKELPEEFQNFGRAPFVDFVDKWFFGTVGQGRFLAIKPKPGVDHVKALTHLQTCLKSYQPSHEHKIGGVAYLMSLWFEPEPT
jgi:hypothetical protein